MDRQEIEQSFTRAGWDLDSSFGEHLIIGYSGDSTSLLAHREVWGADQPVFEILDHENLVTYWVSEIPTPRQATKLLRKIGQPPEENETSTAGLIRRS